MEEIKKIDLKREYVFFSEIRKAKSYPSVNICSHVCDRPRSRLITKDP